MWPLLILAGFHWLHTKRAMILVTLGVATVSALEMALLYSSAPGFNPTRIYDGTDTRAFALLIGAALAMWLPRSRPFAAVTPNARRLLNAVGGASLLGILAMYWGTTQYGAFPYQGGMLLLAVLTALVIGVTIHPGSQLRTVLGWEPLRWVGERSYAIYLWHYPVIVLTTPLERPAQCVPGRPPDRRHPGHRRPVLALHRTTGPSRLTGPAVGADPQPTTGAGRSCGPSAGSWSAVCWSTRPSVPSASSVSSRRRPPTPRHRSRASCPCRHHTTTPSTTTTSHTGTGTASTTTTAPPPAGQDVTAIGDSIMVDAAPYLQEMLPGIAIDAQVGQQLYQVQADVAQLKSEGAVGDRLILELGTNGPYSVSQMEDLHQLLRPHAQDRAGQHPGAAAVAAAGQRDHRRRRPVLPQRHRGQLVRGQRGLSPVLLSGRRPPRSSGGQVLRITAGPGAQDSAAPPPVRHSNRR